MPFLIRPYHRFPVICSVNAYFASVHLFHDLCLIFAIVRDSSCYAKDPK